MSRSPSQLLRRPRRPRPFNHANAAIGRAYGLLSRNFHVQNGFDKDESVVSVFRGRTFSHLLEVREKTWREQFLNLVAGFTPTQRTNLTLLLEPLAARTLATREGFDTKAKLAQWFHKNSTIPAKVYWDYQLVINYIEPLARKGVGPFASYLTLPPDAPIPRFAEPDKICTGVVAARRMRTGSLPISVT